MSWSKNIQTTIKRLNQVKRSLQDQFVDRDKAIELLLLATVCHEHILFIGSPGTAKTQLVTNYTQLVQARSFHYLLTRFTEPSELFGPLDLEKFKQGQYHIHTANMLPEAEIAFLDEVFQGSSAILNTLLTLANERIFHNGAEHQQAPLLSIIGASNLMPEDPSLQAFADRFVLRLHIEPVVDDHIDQLISQGWEIELQRIEAWHMAETGQQSREIAPLSIQQLNELHHSLAEIDMNAIQSIYAAVIRELRAEGIELTDRRVIKGLKLVAGAALLRNSTVAEAQDLWPLYYLWGQTEEAETAANIIGPRIEEDGGEKFQTSRSATEIAEDIRIMAGQEETIRSEIAIGSHLMALNRLRREILKDHHDNSELRQQIETMIQHNINRIDGVEHV